MHSHGEALNGRGVWVSSVTQMIIATPIAIVLGVFAAVVFHLIRAGGLTVAASTIVRSAAAGVPALALLAVAARATDQLWVGACIPFGLAIAYERAAGDRWRRDPTVLAGEVALIVVAFPFVLAVTGWAL